MRLYLAVFLACTALTSHAAPDFRAGAAAIDISPKSFPRIIAGSFLEKRADALTDPLFARAFVLHDGSTTLAMVIVDTCMMEQSLIDEAKTLASQQCGIPTDHIMVSATHTHSAPAAMSCLGTRKDTEYAAFLIPKIAEAIVTAHAALQPARIGWSSIDAPQHTFNRRWIRKPGKEVVDPYGLPSARANMHPGHQSPDVTGPSGPVDSQLSVIALQKTDGTPLAVLANYSQHYFGSTPTSADYYGHFCRHLATKLNQSGDGNGPFVCAMSQGTSGDLMWRNYSSPPKDVTLDAYAAAVADQAAAALQSVTYLDHVPLGIIEKTISLAYRTPDEKRLTWARPIAAQIEEDLPKDKPEVYAREALILHERQRTDLKLQAIRIGSLSIATLPNEVYAITGLKLKAWSPFPQHFNIELANGAEGYIPPPEQHALGGYTTWPARTAGLEVQAEPKIIDTLLTALEKVTAAPRRPSPTLSGPYHQAVQKSGPTHYWHLNEFNPDQRDEPGIARYLDGVPGPAFTQGPPNRAAHLAGGRLRGDMLPPDQDYSISFWFWNALPSDHRAVTGYLFSHGPEQDPACPGLHLGIGGTHANSGKLFLYNGNQAKQSLSGKTTLALQQWHHLTLTRQADSISLHLDGKLELSGTLPSPHKQPAPWFLGGRSDNFSNFEGKLDEAAFFDRILSAEEITAHYDASGHSPPRVAIPTSSPPLSPQASAEKWQIREGYQIELVAAEPLVLDPVAFDWDSHGNLWVVEMADYPLGLDGQGQPGGRIVRLEDRSGDGQFDHRNVIAGDLNFPTGILCWRDGVLVTAAPDILWISSDGTETRTLFTGFSTGNQQLRVNGLRWGMDGWVYCAAGAHNSSYNKETLIESKLNGQKIALGSRDFRFRPDTGEIDPQTGPAQFGRACDDWGRWFGVQNSHPIWHYVLQDHYLRRNPHIIPPDPIHRPLPRNPPVYPASDLEKRFHNFDQAGRFTSACGIEIDRSQQLFTDDATHAFSCEPFHNLVQHILLTDTGPSFEAQLDLDPSQDGVTDFLASSDRWCRPVLVRSGPDGHLWVADMYRYMIEHPQWLPEEGKTELLPHYREGDDKGRIWRIRKTTGTETPAAQAHKPSLDSSIGWLRDRAQMEALWSQTPPPSPPQDAAPQTQIQSAWTRHLLGQLTLPDCLPFLQSPISQVREQAVLLIESLPLTAAELQTLDRQLHPLLADPSEKVRIQLASSLGQWPHPWAAELLVQLLFQAPAASHLQGAALSSVVPHLISISQHFPDQPDESQTHSLSLLIQTALAEKNHEALSRLLTKTNTRPAIEATLTAISGRNLSLSDLQKLPLNPDAQNAIQNLSSLLTSTAQRVQQKTTNPDFEDLSLLAKDSQHRHTVQSILPQLWQQSPSPQILQWIATLQLENAPDLLLAQWEQRTPSLRQDILEALLTQDSWTLELLKRPQAKTCDIATRTRLMQHPSRSISKAATALFSSHGSRQQVLTQFRPALELQGNPAAGKTLFAQLCASCHQLDGIGLPLGPDLVSVRSHDSEKLFNSILDPSAIIEPGYMAYHATLNNGDQLYGIIASETASSITFKLPGNLTRAVLRSDITQLKSTETSFMPEGLEAALTPQTLADLIAYLQGK